MFQYPGSKRQSEMFTVCKTIKDVGVFLYAAASFKFVLRKVPELVPQLSGN